MACSGHSVHRLTVLRRGLLMWLGAVILLVQALAPLSAALAFDAQSGETLQVICTSNGVKMVNVGQNGPPVDPMEALSCPFCVMHAVGAVALAPTVSLSTPVVAAKPNFALPRADLHDDLRSAQPRPPRGPPLAI